MIAEQEVRDFLDEFEELAALRDFDRLEPHIHADAVFRFNDGDFVGLEAVRGAFEKTWQATAEAEEDRYYLSDIEVLTTDAASASATYTYHWEGRFGDQTFAIKGRGTRVLVKDEGRLKIMHEHLSRHPDAT